MDYQETEHTKENELLNSFTLDDYLKCKFTKDIIQNEWDQNVEKDIQQKLYDKISKHKHDLTDKSYNTLYKMNNYHIENLFDIVKYHLKVDYSTNIFKENPNLANPLIKQHIENEVKDIRYKKSQIMNNKGIEPNEIVNDYGEDRRISRSKSKKTSKIHLWFKKTKE
jgi:hypothetical protein